MKKLSFFLAVILFFVFPVSALDSCTTGVISFSGFVPVAICIAASCATYKYLLIKCGKSPEAQHLLASQQDREIDTLAVDDGRVCAICLAGCCGLYFAIAFMAFILTCYPHEGAVNHER